MLRGLALAATLLLHVLAAATAAAQSVNWAQVGNDILGKAEGDNAFAVSLSSDGKTIAVGAAQTSGNGTVRIFRFSAAGWNQIGDDIDGKAAGEVFGASVSLSSDGNTVGIGAVEGLGGSLDTIFSPGLARVYRLDSDVWTQLGGDIKAEAIGDMAGLSVSMSSDGNTIAVGAALNDGTTGNIRDDRGHVRIFSFDNDAWTQLGDAIVGEASGDQSGQSVSMSSDGRTLAIGGFRNDGTSPDSNRGHVRVYRFNSSNAWAQVGLDIDGSQPNSAFGASVSLSADGNTLAIGGGKNSENRYHVSVHRFVSGEWTTVGRFVGGEERDYFGFSVSLSADGSTLAIGASDYSSGEDQLEIGRLSVYRSLSGTWIQLGPNIDGRIAGDELGYHVAASADGSVIASTVPGDTRGRVRVYTIEPLSSPPSASGAESMTPTTTSTLLYVLSPLAGVLVVSLLVFVFRYRRRAGAQLVLTGNGDLESVGGAKAELVEPAAGAHEFDAFLSHNWGEDFYGRDNHDRVSEINKQLRLSGLRTWFDTERLEHGSVSQAIAKGLRQSSVVVIFVTKAYMSKLSGDSDHNYCIAEFMTAVKSKTPSKMIPVVMEEALLNQSDWDEVLLLHLGDSMFVDMSTAAKMKANLPVLAARIRKVGAR